MKCHDSVVIAVIIAGNFFRTDASSVYSIGKKQRKTRRRRLGDRKAKNESETK